MSSINFNNLKSSIDEGDNRGYIFADMYLDIQREPFNTKPNLRPNQDLNKRDIMVAYDDNAIRNSLINLFNTAPGERILLPDYGCELRQYIFEPISELNGRNIGISIKKSIEKWEPRVLIISIGVDVYIDELYYEIKLNLGLPFINNETLELGGILNRDGFTIKD